MDSNALPAAAQPTPEMDLHQQQEDIPYEGATLPEDDTSVVYSEAMEPNIDLPPSRWDLLDLHNKFGHIDMQIVQLMIHCRVLQAPNRVANL